MDSAAHAEVLELSSTAEVLLGIWLTVLLDFSATPQPGLNSSWI